jgi:hypothetical protein
MNPFPDEHELLWLFESEPELLDPEEDISWYYNTLTFRTTRGSDTITCTILPSHTDLEIWWERDGEEIVHLPVSRVAELFVRKEQDREYLEARFPEDMGLHPLRLTLKPFIRISWGVLIEGQEQ